MLSWLQVAGATGSLWAAEAAWAAANRKVEVHKGAVAKATSTFQASVNTPRAQRAEKALQAAEAKLKVGSADCCTLSLLLVTVTVSIVSTILIPSQHVLSYPPSSLKVGTALLCCQHVPLNDWAQCLLLLFGYSPQLPG